MPKKLFPLLIFLMAAANAFSQTPPIGAGVSQDLAKWRAARYSDVRYKLNLTLEKMSPVLKGTMEIRVRVSSPHVSKGSTLPTSDAGIPIVLDWRKIKGFEDRSVVSNVSINGHVAHPSHAMPNAHLGGGLPYEEQNEHLVFSYGVVTGENVIKLDFTSPILTSGSAITRYVDKEDGAEYIYSLFVPSDASTAFPVFDQPDLKARFQLNMAVPPGMGIAVSNTSAFIQGFAKDYYEFDETKPISTYVFAFAAGPWEKVSEPPALAGGRDLRSDNAKKTAGRDNSAELRSPLAVALPPAHAGGTDLLERVSSPHVSKGSTRSQSHVGPSLTVGLPTPETSIYVRKSQAAKFKPHAAEVFRLNREAVKYFEEYFDYKFPFPKYDLVLIPEFPFGGMEHAGATFLRESSIIFPQEPTKNDLVSRATLIFHEAAHQWFGDTVTMRWFDDLWLKEGFATFTAYKAMEKIMPEMNAWKVFYERIKQGAYQTDSTRGTTAIYQPIANLSAAKSAYGNIVYNKAPAFLRQAEFYLGEDKFQTAVRVFLKKNEFGNAGWEDLVKEFEAASGQNLKYFAEDWVTRRGLFKTRLIFLTAKDAYLDDPDPNKRLLSVEETHMPRELPGYEQEMKFRLLLVFSDGTQQIRDFQAHSKPDGLATLRYASVKEIPALAFPNYHDYGYGIFLLDEKSRDYVLKNIQNEKDPFLRTMMWGSLWDSVREGELDPKEYLELVLKVQSAGFSPLERDKSRTLNDDESTIATLLGRTATALNYYLPRVSENETRPPAHAGGSDLRTRVEDMLIERMRNVGTLGQRITYYRAFLNLAESGNARTILKDILNLKFEIKDLKLKTKDKFDIVTRLLILGDPDAPRLLAELERAETSDDAKRYAYAAKAGIATAENKAKYWNDFVSNKEISESWIEAAFGPWNSIRHADLTLPYLERALKALPNHKRSRKIFFVNGWLGAFIGGQRSKDALAIVNKFLADNPDLDKDLRLKILENADVIERAVRIRSKFKN